MSTITQGRHARHPAEAELVERAEAIVPTLSAHAMEAESTYRLAPASVAAVREAGLFALTVPRDAGGFEADLRTLARVGIALGSGCPSTAWVTSLSAFSKRSVGALVRDDARAAYFSDPHALVCASSVAAGHGEEVAGGLRLSGRWHMASGCEDAEWAFLLVPVLRDGAPAGVGSALVRISELAIEHSWRGAGLAGTGSHTLVADGLVVSSGFVRPPANGRITPPPAVVIGAVVAHLAPMIGAARGALAAAGDLFAGSYVPSQTTHRRLTDSPLARHLYGQATHLVDTAVGRILDVAGELDAMDPTDSVPVRERSRLRMHLVSAARECRQASEYLLDAHGASGFAADNPLQRFWRDLAVGTRYHGLNSYVTEEDYDRVLLGLEPPVSLAL
ncbi:acyl-CoA dehydrogenase [Amycolatopsis rhizosphaerae]|uniref:Acyl-CoA dehydrogenase n=1 Tax=Amycolatopsis rhizosphaerae TaxID=2053003 RepID=A0A558CT75_9PSEU|nr:acyl-CoA dehydrogenase family protein [Amycolatopsis rhizosphaerae]TVT51977.1 acyl-CoA dehydrogenase [Amycolatopsis rhizosphaerae]